MKCEDCNKEIDGIVYHRYDFSWDEWAMDRCEYEYDICMDCYNLYINWKIYD